MEATKKQIEIDVENNEKRRLEKIAKEEQEQVEQKKLKQLRFEDEANADGKTEAQSEFVTSTNMFTKDGSVSSFTASKVTESVSVMRVSRRTLKRTESEKKLKDWSDGEGLTSEFDDDVVQSCPCLTTELYLMNNIDNEKEIATLKLQIQEKIKIILKLEADIKELLETIARLEKLLKGKKDC